ncbi:MAG: hypothetical protein ACJ0QL_00570 [Parvicellaceae bacterium]
MNKFLPQFSLVISLLFSVGLTYSQKADDRIIVAYGYQYVSELVKNNPQRIEYLNYFLDHSYEIITSTKNADDKYSLLSEFLKKPKYNNNVNYSLDLNHFNVLMYNLPRDKKLKKVYRIDNTDLLIVMFSEEFFVENYNNFKNKNK